jgi:multidrug resistance efflux pump
LGQAEQYLKKTAKEVKAFRRVKNAQSAKRADRRKYCSSSPYLFRTQKTVRFKKEARKAQELFKKQARLRWFKFVQSHPEIFHIPNFLNNRKKRLKKQEMMMLERAKSEQSRSLKTAISSIKKEMSEKERTILYKKVRGWIQKAMDELENKIETADEVLLLTKNLSKGKNNQKGINEILRENT